MTDSYDHLFPVYQQNAALSNDERIQWIKRDRWVSLPQAEAALKQLHEILHYPPRGRMPCLLLFGSTGMGKSQILTRFAELNQSTYDERAGIRSSPVMVVQMPPQPTEEDFYAELLIAANFSDGCHMNLRTLRNLARRTLAELGVKMLILDEIDKMLAGTARQQRVFLNTVRFLTNDLQIPIVCAGTEDARIAVLTDPHLADRFGAFELLRWGDDNGLRQLMASFSGLLPLRSPSPLDSVAVRKRVIELTHGVTGRIFRLMEAAAVQAIRNGREMIDGSSFDDENLLLPLVSMQVAAGRRRAARSRAA